MMTVPSRSLYKIRVRFYISVSLLEKSGSQTSGTLIVTPVRCMVGWYGTSYWLQSGPLFERACRLKLCLSWRISFVPPSTQIRRLALIWYPRHQTTMGASSGICGQG